MERQIENRIFLRVSTVQMLCRLMAVLIDTGVASVGEYGVVKKNLTALAKTGKIAPVVAPKLLTGQEAAEMLNVSYSQFRQLEKEGVFPFKRRMIGGKTVRFLNTDILDYMLVGSLERDDADECCNV